MKFLIVEPSPLPILIPLGPIIRLGILFSNTLSLHSSLNVRDHISHPYSTTGNIIVLNLYVIFFKLYSYIKFILIFFVFLVENSE